MKNQEAKKKEYQKPELKDLQQEHKLTAFGKPPACTPGGANVPILCTPGSGN
jgi:hypothetical protein